MAGDLALAPYHDLKGKMIMQVNMKKGNGKNSITSKQFNSDQYCGRVHGEGNCKGM